MYSGEFERIGKRLFAEHLVGGNFGNMSMRKGDGFFIKRTGIYLSMGTSQLYDFWNMFPVQAQAPMAITTTGLAASW